MRPQKHRFAIAACARWETRYIAEWLTYHRAIGFDHVYLYCNDDDPEPLYQAVLPFLQGSDPFVSFRFYPEQGQHRKMLQHFGAHDLDDVEWVSFLDIDEFIRLPPGHTLADFMAAFAPIADCVLFNWLRFGPNGHATPPAQNVLSAYTRREATLHPLTKYLARGDALRRTGILERAVTNRFVHWLSEFTPAPLRAVNVLGEDMRRYPEGFPESATDFIRAPARHHRIVETAVIQHYPFRSEQAFEERAARGLGGDFAGEEAWRKLAHSDAFRGFVDQLNAVEDPRLALFWREMLRPAWDWDVTGQIGGGLISAGKTAALGAGGERLAHWLQLDLGGPALITEILVYRRFAGMVPDWRFSLAVSIDGHAWAELDRRAEGADGAARHRWNGPGAAWSRFVRVTGPGPGAPADRLEVYGQMTGRATPPLA